MRILLFIGMLIVFISAFFILFIFDTVVKRQAACLSGLEEGTCDMKDVSSILILGIALIALFIIVDGVTIFIIIKTISSSGSSYVSY